MTLDRDDLILLDTVTVGRSRWQIMLGDHGAALHFMIFDGAGRRMGLAAGMEMQDRVFDLNDIRIKENFRRRGVGTVLLQAMLDELTRRGFTRVNAKTTPQDRRENPKLLGWYRRYGFRWDPQTFSLSAEVPMWWVASSPSSSSSTQS